MLDRRKNPFSPGAGTQPPELAGREQILDEVQIVLERSLAGVFARSSIFVGLRGVGKTVLLNRVRDMASSLGFMTVFIEAREETDLSALLIPPLRKVLLRLNAAEQVSAIARRGLRVFRSFANGVKGKLHMAGVDLELGIHAEAGAADSGILEEDLAELLVAIGEAAQDRKTAICLIVDELQYLSEVELSALIIGLHQIAQRKLPLVLYAAGLPLILSLAGRSKSYSERLFTFPAIGTLDEAAARRAIERPMRSLGVALEPEATDAILASSGRYPYFLQQWGYETWEVAGGSPVTIRDVKKATRRAIQQLDESFFRVRFDRLTRREKDFVFAMMHLGGTTQRTGDIAEQLGVKATSIGPLRNKLIGKGMVYSPSYGDNAFTVPLFGDFLRRQLRPGEHDAQLRLTP